MMRLKTRISATIAGAALAVASGACSATAFTDFNLFQIAAGPLTTENFDGAPWIDGSNPMPTVNLGVSWTAQDDLFGTQVVARSGPRSISDVDGSNVLDQLFAAMPGGVTAVGGWVSGFSQQGSVLLQAFDAGGALLESALVDLSNAGDGFLFVGVTTAQAIASVSFQKPPVPGGPDDFALDDFVFNRVPEPATIAMLGLPLAVIALAGTRRRRRAG